MIKINDHEIKSRKICELLKTSEEVVISGIGGRFPRSNSVDEFADNLYNNVDMITEDVDGERWPQWLYGMNSRMGRIKDIDKFDGHYFGILSRMADHTDPQSRILLETTLEAICDAGIAPQNLRGTKTGVYIGYTSIAAPDGIPQEVQKDMRQSFMDSSLWITGTAKSMYANRVSFVFDLHGPSMVIDTACSSSLVAFDQAVTDLRLGKCEQAIVGTTQINFTPFTNQVFQASHVNSPDGMSRVWDKDANGYVRGEAVVCVLLQKKSLAKRVYATVLHSRTNIDGYKKSGNFFPSKECQQDLLEEAYKEADVEPGQINYFEAHGTGTKVGDLQEATAIYQAYCKNGRKDNLLVGLAKSSIGHGEGTSGLASLVKAIIAFENRKIASNLHLKELKPEIAKMCPPMVPVTANTEFKPSIAGVNSFGVGGVNAHVLLKVNDKEVDEDSFKIVDSIPRLVNVCGRTLEGVDHLFDFIQKNPDKATREFLALINDMSKMKKQLNSAGFPYRGSIIIKNKVNEDGTTALEYVKESSMLVGDKQVWYFYSGMGSQWLGMAKPLMINPTFANVIHRCAEELKKFRVDLLHILFSEEPTALDEVVNPFVAITSMQIALTDVLRELDVQPDGIIGHSFGEIACAYADGCLTLEQAITCSYWRGQVVADGSVAEGVMAAVGLSWEEAVRRCPKNVHAACDNAPDLVTISGLKNDTEKFLETLKAENVFVRKVTGKNLVPYHTHFLSPLADVMKKILKKVIPEPKLRSKKWISTAVKESKNIEEPLKMASAEYFVNNLLSPVLFTSAIRQLPEDALVIEVAPHSLFASVIKRTLENVNYVGMMKKQLKDLDQVEFLLNSLGKVYQLGVNVAIEKLYPKVEWPVPRATQSISSLIKLDHSQSYLVKKWPQYFFPATSADMTFEFSMDNIDDQYLKDHCIEGRVIFPATGYLMLAWRRLAASRGVQWNQFPVVFENVQFRRPVIFENGQAKLTVRYLEPTGQFLVLEKNQVAAMGKIYVPEDEDQVLELQQYLDEEKPEDESLTLSSDEFYRNIRINGYDYGPSFQNISDATFIDFYNASGHIRYTNNIKFDAFLDCVLQIPMVMTPMRGLFVPVMLQSLRCDPKMLFETIKSLKVEISDEETSHDDMMDEVSGISSSKLKKEVEGSEEHAELMAMKDEMRDEIEQFSELTGSGKEKWLSLVPARIMMDLRAVVLKGLEVRGLIPVNIPRRHLSNELRFEKYSFIPYDEDKAIERFHKDEVTRYVKASSILASRFLDILTFENGNDYQSITSLINEDEDIKNNNLVKDKAIQELIEHPQEEHVLVQVYNYLLKEKLEADKVMESTDKILAALSENLKEGKFGLSSDLINLVGRNERLIRPLLDVVNENSTPIKLLNVLELNPGKGIIGFDVIQRMTETFVVSVTVDYTIGSIESDQLSKSEELKKNAFNVVKWDPNESLMPKGIKQLDLLIHRDDVKVWSLDIDLYLEEAYNAVKANGFFLAIFRSKMTAPELVLAHLIGSEAVTEKQLANRITEFEKAAIAKGFLKVSQKSDSMLFTSLLFKKANKEIVTDKQAVIMLKPRQYEWLDQLKSMIQEYKGKPKTENIWLVGNDIDGTVGLTTCLRMESGGEKIRCIFDADNRLPMPVDFNKSPYKELLTNDLVMNVFKNGSFGSWRHLIVPKYDDQVETDEAYANVGFRGDISSIQWFDSKQMQIHQVMFSSKKVNSIKCHVYYTALNFHDVMLATGRLQPGPEAAIIDCLIGTEFAGIRCDNHQKVFGFALNYGIAPTINTYDQLIFPLPEDWSMADASTLSSVYMTAWYGLIERAQLKKGETVLIHSASGGVGQASMTICQHMKCKIFVTVGNDEKREFIKKTYGLTDDVIFSSKTMDFEARVLQLTKGIGVDVVVNSLHEEKLLASLRCLAQDGRFVEIGKFDFQMNTPLPSFFFLKNLSFHGTAIDRFLMLEKDEYVELVNKFGIWIKDGIEKGFVRPINKTIFEASKVKKAFQYLMNGKHIGKVLIKVRDEETETTPKPVIMKATVRTWFNPDKVYIVIGGLGGMGLEVVYWLMSRGARKLIITSRSGIRTPSQRVFFKQLEEYGKMFEAFKIDVRVSTDDVSTKTGTEKLFDLAKSMGIIGGIFQLAVVLRDALFENQTNEDWEQVCDSKVEATINLDEASRRLPYQLDYFVCFSSCACGRGNSGQSNYAYGNSVMERICEQRKEDGHHAVAIQWGPIGDVGLAAEKFDENRMKMAGLFLQRLPSWTYVLDRALQMDHAVVGSMLRSDRQVKEGSNEENIMNQLWSALGVDPKTLPNHITLGELGMESFVAVELQQRLERDFDISLSINEIRKITVGELKEFQSGNRDKLKVYAADIKTARANLAKINFTIPTDPITRLNDHHEGKPIFLLPPLEGIYDNLLAMAKIIPSPVYGVNWTEEMDQMKTIKEVALHCIKVLKNVTGGKSYDLVTFSLGSLIAMKMCHKRAPIDKLIVIDAFSAQKNTDFDDDSQNFEQLFRFINRNVPKSFHQRIRTDVMKVKGEEERVNKVIEELKDFGGKSINGKDMEKIIRQSAERAKMVVAFRKKIIKKLEKATGRLQKKALAANEKFFKRKVNNKVIVIKSTDNPNDTELLDEEVLDTYGLTKDMIEGKYQMELVIGAPEDVLTVNLEKTCEIIKQNI